MSDGRVTNEAIEAYFPCTHNISDKPSSPGVIYHTSIYIELVSTCTYGRPGPRDQPAFHVGDVVLTTITIHLRDIQNGVLNEPLNIFQPKAPRQTLLFRNLQIHQRADKNSVAVGPLLNFLTHYIVSYKLWQHITNI